MTIQTSLVPVKSAPETSFPTAAKAGERAKVTSRMSWQAYRKEHGINKSTPKADVKAEQAKFMLHKAQARTQARAIGAMLVSGEGFDLAVSTWSNKAGARQFQVRGYQLNGKEAGSALAQQADTMAKQAAEIAALTAKLSALEKSGVNPADAKTILENA